jgi:CBS domain-containing protein
MVSEIDATTIIIGHLTGDPGCFERAEMDKVLVSMKEQDNTMGKENCIDCCMKRKVIFGHPETTVKEAALLMAENNVGTLPVVDETSVLVGVTTMRDVVQIFLPDFVPLLSNIRFVRDYGDLGTPSRESMQRAESLLVADLMEEPVSVEDDCTLIRALSFMEKHRIRDLPVVKEGKLVGIASRVDIGRAFLSTWLSAHDE